MAEEAAARAAEDPGAGVLPEERVEPEALVPLVAAVHSDHRDSDFGLNDTANTTGLSQTSARHSCRTSFVQTFGPHHSPEPGERPSSNSTFNAQTFCFQRNA